MSYHTVYDVTREAPDWWFAAIGLVFIVIGVGLFIFRQRAARPHRRAIFAVFFAGFATLWTSLAGWGIVIRHWQVQRLLRDGQTLEVEGVVEDFHPMPYQGHDTERFTVAGVRFAYSDYVLDPGFRQTSSHGGPMREGLRVRIHYAGPARRPWILKLEVADGPAP